MYKELGHEVVVADNDANVIYSVGEPTILLDKVDEEDEVELEPEAEDKQPKGKIRTFGKGIYDAMKKIVDD